MTGPGAMKSLSCTNRECALSGKAAAAGIIRHGFCETKRGRRRRYRCRSCGATFCANIGTPYHRLQHRRVTFDDVAALSVEDLNRSPILRVKRIGWNKLARWLERAGECCRRFNDQEMTGLHVEELQADEIRTIVVSKQQPLWAFAVIDVWSRLWPATVVGRRSYRYPLALFQDVAKRMNPAFFPLIATDGFAFYERVVRRVFGPACLYGQVIKTRRNVHVVRVERRELLGAAWRWEQALCDSEDSAKLNTSFIERLKLTIRQGSAYLCRRTLCYARRPERLEAHLELLRRHYNFIRPHRALKFGREIRTPAMQAGLTKRRRTFREMIFSSTIVLLVWKKLTCVFVRSVSSVIYDETRMPLAA